MLPTQRKNSRNFDKVDRDRSGFITSNEVEDLLYETYGFPPLEKEVKMFMEEFDSKHVVKYPGKNLHLLWHD